MSAKVIDSHLASIINKDLVLNSYSENTIIAYVRTIFKQDDRTKVKNYRPVTLLNIFSKIFKRFTHENLTPFDFFLSEFNSAYRKTCKNHED